MLTNHIIIRLRRVLYIQMKWFLLVLLLLSYSNAQSMSLSFTNRSINALAQYQVTIFRLSTTPISATDIITLQFPSDSYTQSQLSSVSCSPPCTVSVPTLTVTIPGSEFPPTAWPLTFTLINVQNPPSTKPPSVYLASWSNSTDVVENYTYYFGGFDANAMKGCTVTFTPNIVNTVGRAEMQLTTNDAVLVGGYVVVQFPSKWANSVGNQAVVSGSGVVGCDSGAVGLGGTIGCVSNSSGAITVSGFTDNISGKFDVNLQGIRSPPISSPDLTTTISSFDPSGYLINGPSPCFASSPTPHPLSLSLFTTPPKVSSQFSPTFTFLSTDPIASGDTLKISILQPNITAINTSRIIIVVTDTNNFTDIVSLNASQSSPSEGIFGYTMPKMTFKTYVGVNLSVYVSGGSYQAAVNTKPREGWGVGLERAGYGYALGTVWVTPETSELGGLGVSVDNPLINANTQYTVTFTTSSIVSSLGRVQIELPANIRSSTYSEQKCVSTSGNGISSNALCALSGGILTVTNIFLSFVQAKTIITVKFTGVTNPGSSRPTNSFKITTFYDDTQYMTDQSNNLVFVASPDTITSCTVSRNSDLVGVSTQYTFEYTLKNDLLANSNILIKLPTQIIAYSNTALSISVNGSAAQQKTAVILNSIVQSINITSPYTNTIAAGSVLSIVVDSLKNPSSTKQPGSFSLFSYDGIYLIEEITNGVAVGAATPNQFSQVSVASGSSVNGEVATYTLTFKTSIDYPVDTILKLIIPQQIIVPANSACSSSLGFISTVLICTVNSNQLMITIPQALSTGVIYQIKINNIQNPRTFTQTGNFTLTSYIDNMTYIIDSSSIVGIQNTQPNAIISLTSNVINPTQSYLNSNQTIEFNLTTSNPLIPTDYIELTYPSYYIFVGQIGKSVCASSNFICLPQSSNNSKIKISFVSFSNVTTLSIQLTNYKSPMTLPSIPQYFTINTFDSNSNPIDQFNTSNPSSQTTFQLTCVYPCETCNLALGKTICLTCYDPPVNVNNYLLNTSCVSSCGGGYFAFGPEPTCEKCQSPCEDCIGNQSNCTSCRNQTGNLFKFYDVLIGQCVTVCPNGYYPQPSGTNYICQKCNSTCTTCQNLAQNCTSCTSPLLLHLNQCIGTCPQGMYAGVATCILCDASCKNCSGTATECGVCADGYARRNTSAVLCYNDCGEFVAFEGVCQCAGECLTCKGTIGNCTSCNLSSPTFPYYYLQNSIGECIDKCPDGMYVEVGVCTVCGSNCSTCSSKFVCTSCNSSYIFYNSKCITECPAGKYNVSNLCENCSSSCLTCIGSSTYCTVCSSGLSLSGNDCVVSCPNGTVSEPNNNGGKVCTPCNQSCLLCSGAANHCQSCKPSTNFYNNHCFQDCPATTIANNGQCVGCNSPCQTCQTTRDICLTCLPTFFTVKGSNSIVDCVTNCPEISLFANGTECIQCQKPCETCNQSAYSCASCNLSMYLQGDDCLDDCTSGFFKYNQSCVASCPQKMIVVNNTCTEKPNNTVPDKSSKQSPPFIMVIPTPFTFAALTAIFVIVIAKVSFPQTYLPSIATAALSILESLSWIAVLVCLFIGSRIVYAGFICLATSLVIHVINNVVAVVFFCKYIKRDSIFKKLYDNSAPFLLRLSVYSLSLVNHKWLHILFSKTLNKPYLRSPLSHPIIFTPIQICTYISFLPQLLCLIGCCLTAIDYPTTSQLYMFSIDSIIITVLTSLCSIWNIKKPEGFFEQDNNIRSEARQELNVNQTIEDLVGGEEEIGAGVGRRGKENYGVGFSGTSSEYCSEVNEEVMRGLGRRKENQLLVVRQKENVSRELIFQAQNDIIDDKNLKLPGNEQKLDESIVNQLMIESLSEESNKIRSQRDLPSGLLKQNQDQTLPSKPYRTINGPETIAHNTDGKFSQKYNSQFGDNQNNFIFNQRFDIEVQDVGDLNEQIHKMPNFQRQQTRTISLSTLKKPRARRYSKQGKSKQRNSQNFNAESLNSSAKKQKVPIKSKMHTYYFPQSSNHTSIEAFSFPKDYFQKFDENISKVPPNRVQTDLSMRDTHINLTPLQVQQISVHQRSKTSMQQQHHGKIKKQNIASSQMLILEDSVGKPKQEENNQGSEVKK